MEIRREGSPTPLFLVESKLDSGLGIGQLKKYKSALAKLPKSTRLVILTRHGIDENLWPHTPQNTVWLSWSMVAETASMSARRASRLDQFLLRDFLAMAKLKGIHSIPRMTTDSLKRLQMFSLFSCDKSSRLHHKTVSAVDLAMQRLIEHRDSVWESLFARAGAWRPYQNIYKLDNKYAVLHAGFWRPRPRRNVRESYIALELVCSAKPRLHVNWGWKLTPRHPRYDRDYPYEDREAYYPAPFTRKIFKKPMPQATKELEGGLRRIGASFLKSRYAG